MDEHFNLPNAHEDSLELYGLELEVYDGQIMHMVVYDNDKPLVLTLEEIIEAQKEYTFRNPRGRYSIFPVERLSEKLKTLQW